MFYYNYKLLCVSIAFRGPGERSRRYSDSYKDIYLYRIDENEGFDEEEDKVPSIK